MKAKSNLAARDIILYVCRKVMTALNPHWINVGFFFFFFIKTPCCFHGHTSSLPLGLQRPDEAHEPTRCFHLIKFARRLNPNGLELNLSNLLGEFVRKGSVKVITGRARRKFQSTQINPKGMRLR